MACTQSIEDGSPTSADLAFVEPAWLVLSDGTRHPILVAIQGAFAALLREEEEPAAEPNAAPDVPREATRLDRLADLELPVAVVLGRAKLQIREVLKLTAGSLVELDRRVGEPVDIVVHNAIVARGEVVSVGGNYGVKIQEVMSRADRFALQAAAATRSARVAYQPVLN